MEEMMGDDILGAWPLERVPDGYQMDTTSYEKGMAFLDGLDIEDWGCATAYAKRFHKNGAYRGLDGTKSDYCDEVVDLRTYRSEVDGIFMRHVLEHNYRWREILENAMASFQKRMALILFTPFSETTQELVKRGPIPDLAFRRKAITGLLWPNPFAEETLVTGTWYKQEHIFYITKGVHP